VFPVDRSEEVKRFLVASLNEYLGEYGAFGSLPVKLAKLSEQELVSERKKLDLVAYNY